MPGRKAGVAAEDNLEEFTDPANYDLEEAPGLARRVEFYVGLAMQVGGPVLDLACGTGLLALPMAERGLKVTGVDLARPMLEHARSKAVGQRLDVEWIEADARSFDLGRRFDLIILTGHAFQAFLTRDDQDRMLSRVRRHLAAGGLFAFENRNPSGHDLRSHADEEVWQSYTNVEGRPVVISGTQEFDADAQVMRWTSWRRWSDAGRGVERRSRIDCRFMAAPEQNALLHANGFEIDHQFGDWDRRPLWAGSEEIITICSARPDVPR